MIFVRADGIMLAILAVVPYHTATEAADHGLDYEFGPVFRCVNQYGHRCSIQPSSVKCAFYRGPVATLLSLIFPGADEAADNENDIYWAVPNELWAEEYLEIKSDLCKH